MIVNYSRDIENKIRNVQSLRAGSGAKYLLCLHDNGIFIAKRWCRKMPKLIGCEAVIVFAS